MTEANDDAIYHFHKYYNDEEINKITELFNSLSPQYYFIYNLIINDLK